MTGRPVRELPPLSLYVHWPWCVAKCPYCDFNSHELRGELPEREYLAALLADLDQELPLVEGRTLLSVYLGGGTPSLFSAAAIGELLEGVRHRLPLARDAEITLEANPGTIERDRFQAYREAGVNRVSLGVQSFDDRALRRLGRIHGAQEAQAAIEDLHAAGLDNFNLDLMYGLPGQTPGDALRDLELAIDGAPAHLSHYQLTLEPNTLFAARPPRLPDEDSCWRMQDGAAGLLADAGFEAYEVSAWTRGGRESRHNLNYWRFGDYLGIGAGAHGKITGAPGGYVRRRSKNRHPRRFLAGERLAEDRVLSREDLRFEFFLNALRLRGGFDQSLFEERTGLPWREAEPVVLMARERGLLEACPEGFRPSELGWRFMNDLQALFLPGRKTAGA